MKRSENSHKERFSFVHKKTRKSLFFLLTQPKKENIWKTRRFYAEMNYSRKCLQILETYLVHEFPSEQKSLY